MPCLITVDIENGFSDDPAEVAALTRDLAALGVVGVNIEDALGDLAHRCEVIAAATSSGLFVNARTDTHWLKPDGVDLLDEAIRRVRSYVDAGADGVFIPGLADEESIRAAVAAVPVPLNVLALPAGPSFARLAGLGARRVSCGSLPYRAALSAGVRAVDAIAAGEPVPGDVLSYPETQALSAS
ncbi:MAG TPA: isocitrate lyase/phosphoenolpyruvate mutase family protein [Amycolatopsis sp.]|nr:isocitrate lyase/phosphoenolpyruvate mutase family protein [Amycolatopsis sp.]